MTNHPFVTFNGRRSEARLPPYGTKFADNPTPLIWLLSNVGPGAAAVYCGPPGMPAREYCDLTGHQIDLQAATVVLQSRDHLGTTIAIKTA
jgi:hypothetical protein